MAQRNRENGVTLPSVKTNYTERSVTYANQKEETFVREEARPPDAGLSGRVPATNCSAISGGGLQRRLALRRVRHQQTFDSALGLCLPTTGGRGAGAEIAIRAGKSEITNVEWRVAAKHWLLKNDLIKIVWEGKVSPHLNRNLCHN